MLLRRIALALALGAGISALAQEGPNVAQVLFVTSEPLGAEVWLDGQKLEGRTPLLVRDLSAGPHVLGFRKDGWYDTELDLVTPDAAQARALLARRVVDVSFPGQGQVRVAGIPLDDPAGAVSFSAGAIELQPSPDGLDVRPVFPKQSTLDGVRFALPVVLGLSVVLCAREAAMPRDSLDLISPELVAALAMGAGLMAWDVALEAERARFVAGWDQSSVSSSSALRSMMDDYDAVRAELAGGNLGSSMLRVDEFALRYPDSEQAAKAHFDLGMLLLVFGDTGQAALRFELVLERYPLIELYDRAVKALSDCRMAQGDPLAALELLDLLTFRGPGLSREDIERHREYIQETLDSH
ncbi:MAG: PEGA domain-containing protein [Spirochaetales bacterium]|nr:PEGA domain-containing protein [Spirochaetales bacterium]